MQLDHGTWVIVADGRKFVVLRNQGDEEFTDLRVVETAEDENPPTRAQGTDRPGRMPDTSPAGRSAMEETDWHVLQEARFARELGERLRRWAGEKRFSRLVVAADPRTLGALRDEYDATVRAALVREIDRDYTKHTVADIEAALNAA